MTPVTADKGDHDPRQRVPSVGRPLGERAQRPGPAGRRRGGRGWRGRLRDGHRRGESDRAEKLVGGGRTAGKVVDDPLRSRVPPGSHGHSESQPGERIRTRAVRGGAQRRRRIGLVGEREDAGADTAPFGRAAGRDVRAAGPTRTAPPGRRPAGCSAALSRNVELGARLEDLAVVKVAEAQQLQPRTRPVGGAPRAGHHQAIAGRSCSRTTGTNVRAGTPARTTGRCRPVPGRAGAGARPPAAAPAGGPGRRWSAGAGAAQTLGRGVSDTHT